MSSSFQRSLRTTVARQILLGLAGIGLVGFIVMHLSGNLLIFLGPDVFNAYSQKLHDLGALLWVARIGLIAIFVLHVYMTARLWFGNRARAGSRYAVTNYMGGKTIATRSMIVTGGLIFAFVFVHLLDFTFVDKAGPQSMVNGESLGLYGVVFNGFANPLRAAFYIVVMACLGLHLSHAVSSVAVTLGTENSKAVQRADMAAKAVGALIFLAFSSIPVYVLLRVHVLS